MADLTDLFDLEETFLAACEAALDTIPDSAPEYGGSPARSFISAGPPAHDCCDQLTVHSGPIVDGRTKGPVPSAPMAKINHVVLVATVLRCVPVWDGQQPPTPGDQQAAAEQIEYDKWALWNHLFNRWRDGLLFSRCGDVVWVGIQPITPSGGCGGLTLTVRVSLDGYEEVIGS